MTAQPHDPRETIEITLSAPAAAWQEFIAFCDAQGVHRIVRPFIDQILQQANQEPAPADDTKTRPRKPTAVPETPAAE